MKNKIFDASHLPVMPELIQTFWGQKIKSAGDKWELNDIGAKTSLNFSIFENHFISYTVKLYLGTLSVSKSLSHLNNSHDRLVEVFSGINGDDIESEIIQAINDFIKKNRNREREYQIWYLKDWYLWCSDLFIPYFSEEYADYLDNLLISGNHKGQAVLSMEEHSGPLTDVELNCFVEIISQDPLISLGKVLSYMFLTLGSNPRNLCLLKWSDFSIISNTTNKIYLLNVPRIKKRTKSRQDFKTRELDQRVGSLLENYREFSKSEYVFANSLNEPFTAKDITYQFQKYIQQISKKNPGGSLSISPRRLRYTFATKLVLSGVSKERLADLLDHTDLQNVQVYYDLRHKIKGFLTEAESSKMGTLLGRFSGSIQSANVKIKKDIKYFTPTSTTAVGSCGSDSSCELNAPYSCFVCKKFNAFEDSLLWYQKILEDLNTWKRNRALDYDENDRIQFQMDEIIAALVDLISRIKKKEK